MSVLCQRLESAVLKSLLRSTNETEVSESLEVETEALDVTVTPTNIHVVTGYGEFDLNFYAGLSQVEQTMPAVTIHCVLAGTDEAASFIKTIECNVVLRYAADDSTQVPSVPDAMLGVGSWLEDELSSPAGLRDRIEFNDHEIVVSGVTLGNSSRGLDADNRQRWLAYTFTVIAGLGHNP